MTPCLIPLLRSPPLEPDAEPLHFSWASRAAVSRAGPGRNPSSSRSVDQHLGQPDAEHRPSRLPRLGRRQPAVVLGQGVANAHYRIEYCETLGGAWQLLQDIPALSGTTARVVDSSPHSAHTRRFYRAVCVQ